MSNVELQDTIFRKIVEKKFSEQLKPISNQLSAFLDQYAYIYQNEKGLLLNILLESLFHNYDENTNQFTFDFDYVLDKTPIESKEMLFQNVITKFTDNFDISQLNNKEKDSSLTEDQPEESNNSESSDEPHEPSDVLDF